jgi:hypothetical protein
MNRLIHTLVQGSTLGTLGVISKLSENAPFWQQVLWMLAGTFVLDAYLGIAIAIFDLKKKP